MDLDGKFRNSLVKRIQHLPAHKLKHVDDILTDIEDHKDTKEKTLQLAGSWKDLDDKSFKNLTSNLHRNRNNDRQILKIN